ncbi:MAG: rhodanese-related sulfurtransferase, partial [Chitinophagaceae bacterium]
MAVLHNRVSQKELKQKLYEETTPRITLSFYQYAVIADPQTFRDDFYKSLDELNVFGRIYIASEGINAQVSVPNINFDAFKIYIHSIPFLQKVRLNLAVDNDGKSFWVLKIKVREKIVADGITDPDFDMANKGRYVNAEEFNVLTNDPDTIVVDMRNHYEYEIGHFEHALEVPSDTFREQLPMIVEMLSGNKDKNIIMY